MKISMILLVLLAVPASLPAQGWAGLPFGTSLAHVQNVLARQPPICTFPQTGDENDCTGLTIEQLPTDGDYTIKPPFELWLGALNSPLHFKSLLHFFNADRQLARVDLTLDVEKHKAEGMNAADLVEFASEPVLNELLGKYGVPLAISPACEASETRRLLDSNADVIDCSVLWKSQNILVNLVWQYQPQPNQYSLLVRYSMLQSGL
ncbi:MAG TPA: hypothetical protein VHA14_11575 [Bryobacteraceae bacterium]|nr:hypothetical protein [Bryobacteraceae bacterium]